ncbi:hypothetical protein [Spiroplasma poulsonii]|uniref:hypothetical protein n=1 Tax=Spiroplasma poulsonii TaxID=2138 RepID=UPI001F4CA89A|nr:hypothetical protein [Spiroplasma poulsonii]UNF62591.1 hypothetical protein MNU24_03805 [Spiroplasma poulsonii]
MIILMIKLLLLMLRNSIQRLKDKTILLVKKKNTVKATSNYQTKETKNYCNRSFRSEKTWLCFI